jgi:Ni,Fe-hydrogenase maturation factor
VPERMVLLGVVPAHLDLGLDLSPQVAAALPSLIGAALTELRNWGIVERERERPT